eukprot:CAMPEP_0182858458 /NCGR_PEP_ID=MMETSP0034_2-20130328/3693_1 /TAXON_ID=156128 /ORGANISM="Nephroselmis pyriformis, Strain CCMP717" /LENGTH=40 /DNA_ID= /DNA_START= /DNA_END= /DNA_ORIENTATION=
MDKALRKSLPRLSATSPVQMQEGLTLQQLLALLPQQLQTE